MVCLNLCVSATSASLVCGQRTHSKSGEVMELVQQKVHVKQTEDTGEEEEWMGLGPRSWVTGQGDR